jgi:2,3-bisphosphoglycerate-independent phosphoglycerate mutase
MDFYKVPIGFGLALAANEPAMRAYSAMSESQKQTIIDRAHNVRSEKEMHALVASLAKGRME